MRIDSDSVSGFQGNFAVVGCDEGDEDFAHWGDAMKTLYETHEEKRHATTFYSPNSVDRIEECDCGVRFLHNPCVGYPISLQPKIPVGEFVIDWERIREGAQ